MPDLLGVMRDRPFKLLSLVASLWAVAALHNGRVDGRGVYSKSVALTESVYIIERRTNQLRGNILFRHLQVVAFEWLVASVECEVELPRAEEVLVLGTTPHVQEVSRTVYYPFPYLHSDVQLSRDLPYAARALRRYCGATYRDSRIA